MTEKQKTVLSVLSIDGGGIRGIIPAMILAEIEGRTLREIRRLIDGNGTAENRRPKLHNAISKIVKTENGKDFIPVSKLFNLVAGASTGGILALALTVPDPQDKKQPKYTAAKLANLYEADGKKIFRRLPGISSIARFLKVKYSSKGIKCVLNGRFRETRLSEALIPVLIPSYEMIQQRAWFFRSTRAAADETQSTCDFLMKDVALATSAAPTYFSRHQMDATDDEKRTYKAEFIDGGIYANHPAMCAFVEARDMTGKDILLVSLGTGERSSFPKGGPRSGFIFWARRIFNVIFDGASDTVRYQLERFITDCRRFYRFQPVLTGKNIELDDVGAMTELKEVAKEFIKQEDSRLEELCCCLAKRFLNQLEDENS